MLSVNNYLQQYTNVLIRVLYCAGFGIINLIITSHVGAQVSQQDSVSEQARQPIRPALETVKRQPVALDNDGVLRLQATIRGDQQQPRILSIVPWDSPAHRRISRVALTGETSNKLAPLHRHTFLQRIALYDQLKSNIPDTKDSQ